MLVRGKSIAGFVTLVGVWLIGVSLKFAFFGPFLSATHFWNGVLVGTVLVCVAGYALNSVQNKEPISTGLSLLLLLFGIWLIVFPFVSAPLSLSSLWSDVICGFLIVVLTGYNSYQKWDTKQGNFLIEDTNQ